jgi:hypothetical protein
MASFAKPETFLHSFGPSFNVSRSLEDKQLLSAKSSKDLGGSQPGKIKTGLVARGTAGGPTCAVEPGAMRIAKAVATRP